MTDHIGATSPTRQFAPLAIILGIPLLFAAIFFYTSPVVLETGGQQGIFKCGSPSSPNSDAGNLCAPPEKVERNKAIYSGLSGVALLGLGGAWLLRGSSRDQEEDWDEDSPRRRRRAEDIDLRADAGRERPGAEGRRSGLPTRRERREGAAGQRRREPVEHEGADRDLADRDLDDHGLDDPEPESTPQPRRSDGRRSARRDDDVGDPAPRRREDDDWSSDGWR